MIIECDNCHSRKAIEGDYDLESLDLEYCQYCGKKSWSIRETARLLMCDDCRNLISRQAVFCPHCGAGKNSIPAKVIRFDPEFQDYVKMIIYFFCASIVVAVLAFLLFMVIYTVKFAR